MLGERALSWAEWGRCSPLRQSPELGLRRLVCPPAGSKQTALPHSLVFVFYKAVHTLDPGQAQCLHSLGAVKEPSHESSQLASTDPCITSSRLHRSSSVVRATGSSLQGGNYLKWMGDPELRGGCGGALFSARRHRVRRAGACYVVPRVCVNNLTRSGKCLR